MTWLQTASGDWHAASLITLFAWILATGVSGFFLFAKLRVDRRDRDRSAETAKAVAAAAQSVKDKTEEAATKVAQAEAELEKTKQALGESRKEVQALNEKTKQIIQLPDGTMLMGSARSGKPTVLDSLFTKIDQSLKAGNLPVAFETVKECIGIIEATDVALRSMGPLSDSAKRFSPEALAELYLLGAKLSMNEGQDDQSLGWARKAVEKHPTGENKAWLFASLINSNLRPEAQTLFGKINPKTDAEGDLFRKTLQQFNFTLGEALDGRVTAQ